MLLPKISIVTPTYNQGSYIEQSIQSVLNQSYDNLEYIIIDGGSTDNTVEIIRKYSKYLSYWVSEKDSGQSDAINKGLKLCTGEIFNWLNSDDYLEPGALKTIAETFTPNVSMVAGRVRLFEGEGNRESTIEMVQHANLSAKGLMYWANGMQFVQPGVWLRRNLIFKCGGIDKKFNYCFDWDLYIRYLNSFPAVGYTDRLLMHFRYHDQSKTRSKPEQFRNEEWEVIYKLSLQNNDGSLRNIAKTKWAEKDWLPVLRENIRQTTTSKVSRIFTIVRSIDGLNIRLWRATAGAIKAIILS